MTNWQRPEVGLTGLGVTAAVGQGKAAFLEGLLAGEHRFDVMRRSGRQRASAFLGAELPPLSVSERLSQRLLRSASLSAQALLVTVDEAWQEARLDDVDPLRIGLVIGGSNIQQRELIAMYERYAERPQFLRPSYALNFMDTDLCGLCTEQFGIKGMAYTVGGASASGQMATIHAAQAVQAGEVDVCIAVGALMDLSYWECIALRGLGAMGSDRYADQPAAACRPFDRQRDGFIFGEACGAVVIERIGSSVRAGITPYARLSGWAVAVDGNRNPDPSLEGEVRVVQRTLQKAGLSAAAIDYVNPHGTASTLGDEIELEAIRQSGLAAARINTTKSIIGHSLCAAGTVELIASALQMRASRLHPCRNLDEPIDGSLSWVGQQSEAWEIRNALNLSFGFGGVNTAVCLTNLA